MGCCGSPLITSVSPFSVWKNVAATEGMFLSLKLKTYKKYHLPTHYWRGLLIAASYLGPDWAQLWLILPIIRHQILYETIIVLDYFCIPESVLQKPQKLVSQIALFCLYSASLAQNQDFYKDEPPPMNHLCFHFYFTQWTVSRLLHPVWLPAAHWHSRIWFLKAWGWQHTCPELFSEELCETGQNMLAISYFVLFFLSFFLGRIKLSFSTTRECSSSQHVTQNREALHCSLNSTTSPQTFEWKCIMPQMWRYS